MTLKVIVKKKQILREAIALGRKEAKILFESYNEIFSLPVRVSALANKFKINIEIQEGLSCRAKYFGSLNYINTSNNKAPQYPKIVINKQISLEEKRFAIAHELGHAVLEMKHPYLLDKWDIGQEYFADAFASEIVAPKTFRDDFVNEFRNLMTAKDILKITNIFGLSISSILTIASNDTSWFKCSKNIWLRIKYIPNIIKKKGSPNLRIVTAHFDKEKFYIPPNRRLLNVCKNIDWLEGMFVGDEKKTDTTILLSEINSSPPPKWLRDIHYSATLYSYKLSPSSFDNAPYFLILAKLKKRIT